jgi:malate dehydrogenase (oxaloacetate-decarboxylating)
MAIKAAYAVANFAEKKGINPDYIMPTMSETEVFAYEAADVAMEAIENGVARIEHDWQTVYDKALKGIMDARKTMDLLMKNGFIKEPNIELLEEAVQKAIDAVT